MRSASLHLVFNFLALERREEKWRSRFGDLHELFERATKTNADKFISGVFRFTTSMYRLSITLREYLECSLIPI